MKSKSDEIREQITTVEAKLSELEAKVNVLRSASEEAQSERNANAFAALVQGDSVSKKKMEELAGKPQQAVAEARDIEAAISGGVKKLLDLRAEFAIAITTEKIEECRALCLEARIKEEEIEKFVSPILKRLAKAQDAEKRLSTALRELSEIVRPHKVRGMLKAPMHIENRAYDLDRGSPCRHLLAHILGKDNVLQGVEIGKYDPSILSYYVGQIDVIEKELDKLSPKSAQPTAA